MTYREGIERIAQLAAISARTEADAGLIELLRELIIDNPRVTSVTLDYEIQRPRFAYDALLRREHVRR